MRASTCWPRSGRTAQTDRDALAASAKAAGIRVADDDSWADVFSRVIVEKVEPNLGIGRATILCEYPTAEAALARPKPGDPRVAERFELYACGVELANAFGELTDAGEQRRRFEAEMDEKARVYGERYPLDEDFLAALAIMPNASGSALGFDRLVMLAAGASGWIRCCGRLFLKPSPARRGFICACRLDGPYRPRLMTAARTLRSAAALADAGLIAPERLPALEAVAARYAVAITPAMAELIDPANESDPIARQFLPARPSCWSRPRRGRRSDRRRNPQPGRGDRPPLSRPRAAEAHPHLRGLLPVLLPPRGGGPGGRAEPVARASWTPPSPTSPATRRSGR
jgi:hypothetical protein